MTYENFSSFAPEEEQQFVVFEKKTSEDARKANHISLGISLGLLFLILVIVIGFWGPIHVPGEEPSAPARAEQHE